MPLALLLVFVWLVAQNAGDLDFGAVLQAVSAIRAPQWLTALAATAISFWAVGRMDAVVHRLLDTGFCNNTARISGITAVATAQVAGFGLLTGTLARWRVLPDTSLWKAAQITGAVSASFMIALGALVAMAVLIVRPDIPGSGVIAAFGLISLIILLAACLWRPCCLMGVKIPPLRGQFSIFGFVLLDTAAAALTLYVLIPEPYLPPPMLFYTIFLIALGAGLLGATPGGVGPFELLFLACLPNLPDAPILAAIMGYRIVYFALPALFAAGVLIAGPTMIFPQKPETNGPRLVGSKGRFDLPIARQALSFNASRAEAGLLRQGEFDLLLDAQDAAVSLVAPTGQCLIMLADPITDKQTPRTILNALEHVAESRMLTPGLYKCGPRMAAAARNAGWCVRKIAIEARVSPATFDISSRKCRRLRQQVRKAKAAEVCVSEAGAILPLDEMRDVATDWAHQRRGARGFSMGLFDEPYVAGQRVYLARQHTRLIGFITLHEAWCERSLDLMCQTSDAPEGTMQYLIAHAIQSAASDGCPNFSLAAVPRVSEHQPFHAVLAPLLDRLTGARGLFVFKSKFAPVWKPLYLAAPGKMGLALASIDLVDRITRPRIKH